MAAEMQRKSFDSPDETRKFEHGKIDLASLGETIIGRAVFEPGWKWSTSVKPIVKTESCQQQHTMYMISGRMRVRMEARSLVFLGP